MFQGTASNVGKSILAAGFCRVFAEAGYSVAPFKAQNMALNSFVTADGLEMGRAQATQARACNLPPDVRMNPVLLKPSGGMGSQVIVMGKPVGHMNAQTYTELKPRLRQTVHECYEFLENHYDIIVIEGAGSPAEVNLKQDDLTNMYVAKMAGCPVVIIGDIDRGGVYAHLAGTFDLLDPDEQDLTAGFIINKFRGDASQLAPANDFIEQRTQRPILGVVPYMNDLRLPDEDSVEFKKRVGKQRPFQKDKINIALVDLPHISNFTDFDPFDADPDVCLRVIDSPDHLPDADIIILPGSKNTLYDMNYLKQKKFVPALLQMSKKGTAVIGICGGFQMLGKRISDKSAVESREKETEGLGLLDMTTEMKKEKRLTQVTATCKENNIKVNGYEIHHGFSITDEIPFLLAESGEVLGYRAKNSGTPMKNIWGTYIHGVFDSARFRNFILNPFRTAKQLPLPGENSYDVDKQLSLLAGNLKQCIDMDRVYKILENQNK